MYASTHVRAQGWARALDAVAALEADTLIAGHRDPRAADDDARRQIGECRRYLEPGSGQAPRAQLCRIRIACR
jgi:hypothetical protein